ncbi:MotA/TolQ/ExbB proton channel family protein [Thermostilla marina]
MPESSVGRKHFLPGILRAFCAAAVLIVGFGNTGVAQAPGTATEPSAATLPPDQAAALAEQALADEPQSTDAEPSNEPPGPVQAPKINVLELAFQGGPLMIPIALMSVVTVVFGLERWLGLRRRKVVPAALITALGEMSESQKGFDPRAAYRLCREHPSAAANVIKAMLLKVGRPLTEVEHAMKEAGEREADRLYANVRFLTLAAAITPLLGLLGTVQGMIQAFFVTSHLPPGANRAELLGQGIYVALVTTFAGLCVAIPASVLAHFFEGRIQTLFRELEETLMGLLPQLERFEGRLVPGSPEPPVEPPVERPRDAKRSVPVPPPPPETKSGGAQWQ